MTVFVKQSTKKGLAEMAFPENKKEGPAMEIGRPLFL